MKTRLQFAFQTLATANSASPVESVTITLPAGLLANPKLFVRVVVASNRHISNN